MTTRCDHAPNLSLRTHACGTAVRPSQAAYAAYDCSPPRSLRSYRHFHSVHAAGRVVREYRASKDGHPVLHAVADLASLAQSADECKVHEVRQRVALVVVRASRRSLWGRLCPETSSSLRKRKWHYQLYTGCMGLLHHTLTSLTDSDRKLCILAFECCLVPPSSSISVMTLNWRASYVDPGRVT